MPKQSSPTSPKNLLLDWSHWLCFTPGHQAIHEALASALHLAAAQLLELDFREIGLMTNVPCGAGGNGIGTILYDNTLGGSGHVYELLKNGKRDWLKMASQLLFKDEAHDSSCEHGCLDCILTSAPERGRTENRPNRKEACEMLRKLLNGEDWCPPISDEPEEQLVPNAHSPSTTMTHEERISRQRHREQNKLSKTRRQ